MIAMGYRVGESVSRVCPIARLHRGLRWRRSFAGVQAFHVSRAQLGDEVKFGQWYIKADPNGDKRWASLRLHDGQGSKHRL